MKIPFVSRARYELLAERLIFAKEQIEALIASNEDLRAIALSKEANASKSAEADEAPSTKPHRRLGADIRAEFRKTAAERAAATGKAK